MVTTTTWLMFLACWMCGAGGLPLTGAGTLLQDTSSRKPDNVIQQTGDTLEVTPHAGVSKKLVQEVLRSFFDELKKRPDLRNGILKGEPASQPEAALAKMQIDTTKPELETPHHLRRRDTTSANVLPAIQKSGQQTISNGLKDQVQLSQTDQHIQPPGQVQRTLTDQHIQTPLDRSGAVLVNETHQNLVGANAARLPVTPQEVALNVQPQYPIPSGVDLIPSDYYYVYYADRGEHDPAVKLKPDDYYYYIEAPLPVQNGIRPSQNGGIPPSAKGAQAIKENPDVKGGALKELKHKNPKDNDSEVSSSVSSVLNEEKELGKLHS